MRGKKLLIPSLALLVVAGGVVATAAVATIAGQGGSVNQTSSSWSPIDIDDQYHFHDTIAISNRTFSKDGIDNVSSHLLTFPNGTKTDESIVLLNQVGNYSLTYTAVVNGKVYSKVERFNVKYGACYFDTTKSSAEYVKEGPEALVYNALTQDESQAEHKKGAAGLKVNLAKDDAFHVTKHFDFRKLTKSDLLVKGYIVPSNQGASDFTTLTFKFTDSQDPSIFLRCSYFAYQVASQGGWSFAGAGGNGQQICGWLKSQNAVYRGEGTGASMMTCFSGYRYNTLNGNESNYIEFDKYPFQVSFDSESMTVYGQGNTEICDLDSSVFFDKFWSGFPSGFADLTITADGYTGSGGTIVLTDLFGNDLENFEFEDTNGPEIVLESEYKELPNGIVNKKYSIPKATAFDDYSKECKVRTEVIYNFAGANPVNISMEDDTFTPKKVGPYAIKYISCDESNNETILTKVVNVYDQLPEIDFDLPGSLVSSCEVGDVVLIENPANISGGSGNKSFEIKAIHGDKVVNINEGTFIPDDMGKWTISYIVKDYLNQEKEKSYDIDVAMSKEYALKGNLKLLDYYVSGSAYQLPEVELFHKVGDKVEVVIADVTVNDASGSRVVKTGTSFTPKVEKNGDTISLKIIAGGLTLFEQNVKGIMAFETTTTTSGATRTRLNLKNYFESSGCDFSGEEALTDNGLKITTTAENGSFKFVKPLNKNDADISLVKISSKNMNAELDIKLIDSYDPTKTVTIKAVTEDMVLKFKYGDAFFIAENSFMNPDLNSVHLKFNNVNIALGSFSNIVKTYDNGIAFDGFNNDVYVEVSFKSFNVNDYLVVESINNHRLNTNASDKTAPQIYLTESYMLEHESNEVFRIPTAYAKDVLSPNVEFTFSVTNSKGEFISDINGVKLENVPYNDNTYIKLTDFGDYRITYNAKEAVDFLKNGNKEAYTIVISVIDKKPPVINITSGYNVEVKVGEYIVIPNFTATDNVTLAENIVKVVTVTDPDGKTHYLETSSDSERDIDPVTGKPVPIVNGFKVAQAGKHIVRISVFDETGNSAMFTYEVIAKEAK